MIPAERSRHGTRSPHLGDLRRRSRAPVRDFAAPGRSRSPRSSFPRRPRGRSRTGKASRTHATAAWLRALAAGVAIVVALYAVVVLMGGLPPVHEWRGALAR
jgi:hypothetical protein